MAWRRGNGSVDIELANTQSWIEGADTDLYGQNGDPGMIRLFWADRAAREQREKDREQWMNRRVMWITVIGGVAGLLKILELVHVLPK